MANNLFVKQGASPDPQMKTTETSSGSGIHMQVLLVGGHPRTYDGIQTLVLTGSSQALTVPAASTFADIYAEGATTSDYARYWENGTAPTATVGKKLKDHEEIPSAAPGSFHAINGSGTVTLRIAYYHYA